MKNVSLHGYNLPEFVSLHGYNSSEFVSLHGYNLPEFVSFVPAWKSNQFLTTFTPSFRDNYG